MIDSEINKEKILVAKIRKTTNVLVDLSSAKDNLFAIRIKTVVPHWLI